MFSFCAIAAQRFSQVSLILSLLLASFWADGQGKKIRVRDDLGNSVVLDGPARRIVSLAPHLTELLFSLEVGNRIVGTSRYSDFPPEAQKLTVVGDAFSLSVEAIVALQPDIIFAWSTGGTNRALGRLRDLGFVIYINEADTIDGIADTISRMAMLVGNQSRGVQLVRTFERKMSDIRASTAKLVRKKVFFQISDQSLYTINGDHLIGQAVKLCNAENIFADEVIPVPLVSKESVIARRPDVIVISKPKGGAISPWVDKWGAFDGYGEKLRWIDPGLISRPSLRMLEGIEQLCAVIQY